ncbi:acyl-homoserine-lactone synthase [Yersinia mollaretii]|nr:acyl-homoserine-lactone synthase [Yersinia mollaretii]MDN0112229.1 acyl-homoserine-lactone synthase [Yersinia mollaretii]
METFDVSYKILTDGLASELFLLRKNVFKDRLNWAATSIY